MIDIFTNRFSRTETLLGADALNRLKKMRVAVFGVGGVGSFTVEALTRSGIGAIDLVDSDDVDITNINRQLIATDKTVGLPKVEVAASRIYEINPECIVTEKKILFTPENSHEFDFSKYDYVVDAVDNVTAKIELAVCCEKSRTPIISSMGTGNKLCPEKFEIADIYRTSVCPLARIMRYELKKRGVKSLKTVYSKEEPILRGRLPASCSFVPGVAGLIIAGEVIKDLIDKR